MDRTQKESLVASLRGTLEQATLVVVTSPRGLTVAQSTRLRRSMRDAGAGFKVTKNRLARIALRGTRLEPLGGLFAGPTAVAWSADAVAAARAAVAFSEEHGNLEILGGGLDGRTLDAPSVVALARLPSLDELRARLAGLVQAPAARVAAVLQAPGGQLARALAARAGQRGADE